MGREGWEKDGGYLCNRDACFSLYNLHLSWTCRRVSEKESGMEGSEFADRIELDG